MRTNPTSTLDIDFEKYMKARKQSSDAHLQGGIPDYAYGPDYAMRQKINAIPGAYALFKAITDHYVPYYKQQVNLNCLKVGPNQFPDVYEYVVDCSRRLGIGIPTVFVEPTASEINAGAYAFEDDAPMITITSALLERFTPGEVKAVLGHECGHVHNNHGVYMLAVKLILNSLTVNMPVVQQIVSLASYPVKLALFAWDRAAEVTSDRAGIICADDPNDEISSKSKFLYGAAFNRGAVDIETVLKQYESMRSTPVRLLELSADHPVAVRRIFAEKEYLCSEVLYTWRPEWKTPDMHLIGKQELDARCEKYIGVIKSGQRGGQE